MSRGKDLRDRDRCACRAFDCYGGDDDKRKHLLELGRMQRTIKRLKKSLSLQQRKWDSLNDYIRFEYYMLCAELYNAKTHEERRELKTRLNDFNYFRGSMLTVMKMNGVVLSDSHSEFVKSKILNFKDRQRILLQFVDGRCEVEPDISLCCFFDEESERDAFIEFARSNEFQDAYEAFKKKINK